MVCLILQKAFFLLFLLKNAIQAYGQKKVIDIVTYAKVLLIITLKKLCRQMKSIDICYAQSGLVWFGSINQIGISLHLCQQFLEPSMREKESIYLDCHFEHTFVEKKKCRIGTKLNWGCSTSKTHQPSQSMSIYKLLMKSFN